MASTRFLLPLALLLLVLIFRQKVTNSIGYQYKNIQGVKEFRFCAPVDPKSTVALGNESLHRNLTLANKLNRLQLRSSSSFFIHILLLLGGDVELNSGDKNHHPCGICSKPVRSDQEGIQCNDCRLWFHKNTGCCEMSTDMYNTLSNSPCVLLCPHCNEPNHSNSFLHDSLATLHPVNSFNYLPTSERQNLPQNLNLDQHGRPTRSKQRKPKQNSMKCMLINCRSVKNKVADIAAIIDEHKPDIILGNKFWLTPDVGNNEIFPIDYNVFRKDRITNPHGGGVFQAVKKDIITERADLNTDCEIIWTQFQLAGRKSRFVLFGSYYRRNASDTKSLEELEASLLKIGNNIHKNNVIIAGDFNAPDIDWQNPGDSNRLVELIDDHDFSQLVHEPTRRQGETHRPCIIE